MLQRTLSLLAILLSVQAACASTIEQQNELSAAQMSYQNLLKMQANDRTDLQLLRDKLQSAEKKLQTIQLEVNKLRAETMLREEMQQANDNRLKEAGIRLNKAWEAVNKPSK